MPCLSAHDSVFLVQLRLTTPAIRLCTVSCIPSVNGFAWHPASWGLVLNITRPLEIAMSAELDLLAVLCIREGYVR